MAKKKAEPAVRLERKVSVRLGEADWLAYSERFRASGLSQSEFFRQCVLTNRTTLIVDTRRPVLLHAINKTGHSLNQLAAAVHAAHRSGQVSDASMLSVLDHLAWIELFLQGVMGHGGMGRADQG